MSKINSRSKGQRGEREIVKFLQDIAETAFMDLGEPIPTIERNQNQSWQGGYDIVGLDDFIAPEVKFCEKLQVDKWWGQAWDQASKAGRMAMPVLFYRQSRKPWRVRYLVTIAGMIDETLVETDLMNFSDWLYSFIIAKKEGRYHG